MKEIDIYVTDIHDSFLPNRIRFTLNIARNFSPRISVDSFFSPRDLWDTKVLHTQEFRAQLTLMLENWLSYEKGHGRS